MSRPNLPEGSRLILLDPGFSSFSGHHYSTALMLKNACEAAKVELLLLSGPNADFAAKPEVFPKAAPVLPQSLYLEDYGPESLRSHADATVSALSGHLAPLLRERDVILCHTASPALLTAVEECLSEGVLPEKTEICLNIQFLAGGIESNGPALCKLRGRRNVRLFSSTASIIAPVRERYGLTLGLFPTPLNAPRLKTRRGSGPPVFGFAGENRLEKNMQMIPPAVWRYLLRGGKGSFILQSHLRYPPPEVRDKVRSALEKKRHAMPLQPGPGSPVVFFQDDVIKQFNNLAERFPDRVRLIFDPLYGDAYFRHLADCDALILPYAPDNYKNRFSQIILEAGLMNASALVSPETALASDAAMMDNGSIVLRECSSQAVYEALWKFEEETEIRRGLAAEAGEKLRAFHNADHLLDILFES